MRGTRRAQLAATGLALALVAGACGGGRDDTGTGSGGGGEDPDEVTLGTTMSGEAFTIDTSTCADYQPTAGVTEDSIKIGTSGPTSGPYGAAFAAIRKGQQAYFEYINDAKGGVDGRKIEFVGTDRDDEYLPAKTVTNVEQLVQQDEVFALFNVLGTANNLAFRDDLNEWCVPNLFVATGAVEWGETEQYPWLIGSLPSYATEALVFADYLKQNEPDASVAILYQNDDFGKGYVEAFEKAIEGSGITVAESRTYEAGESDVSAQMTALGATGADAVLLAATALACPNALKDIKANQGWDPITYISVTCAVKTLIDIGGADAFEDVITVAYLQSPLDPDAADNPGMATYRELGAKYGLSPEDLDNATVQYGWFTGELLVATLEQAAELTRKAVMESAYNLDLDVAMALPGMKVRTDGATDPFPLESMYIARFNGEYFSPEGEVIDFEGKTIDFLR